MKFYKKITTIFKKNPKIFMMFLALGCAISMWWLVSKKDRIEATIDLFLDYSNIPENLIVTDGLTNKISVRLNGPERLLRTVPRDALRKNINLSNIKKGENIVSVGETVKTPEFRAFNVISFDPPTLTVHADRMIKKKVMIEVEVESPLGDGALKYNIDSINPSSIEIKGPEKTMENIKKLSYTIQGDANAKEGTEITYSLTLKTPPLVNPIKKEDSKIDVQYTVTSSRTSMTLDCPIIVESFTPDEYETDPRKISVQVTIPAALKDNKEYLKQATATVIPPEMAPGESRRVAVKMNFPDGMVKAAAAEREVTITKLEKD